MLRFLKSLVDSEVMGEEIVDKNVDVYFQAKRMQPSLSSFDWLMATFLGRVQARGNVVNDEVIHHAEYVCNMLKDIPEPNNARALGLMLLAQERPDITEQYPKFMSELSQLVPD